VQRYERERPGELVHFDVKKLGVVPTKVVDRREDEPAGCLGVRPSS
jgi:hypothetical protein